MAWEPRRNGKKYYYRSVRVGPKVKKQYLGKGPEAQAAAAADQKKRTDAAAAKRFAAEADARLLTASRHTAKVDQWCRLLIDATLFAEGFHRSYRHPWRRRRGT